MKISEKLARLRAQMRADGISVFIVTANDPHGSEYVPEYYRALQHLSGFTGSAGTLVVGEDFADLWTDSRYFIQAEMQLPAGLITLKKLRVPHQPEYMEWLNLNLPSGARVGTDFNTFPAGLGIRFQRLFASRLHLLDKNYLPATWPDRPPLPLGRVLRLKESQSGASARTKLSRLQESLKSERLDACLLSALDDIAWLFNLRSEDVPFNPVVLAHALLTQHTATLFTLPGKLSEGQIKALAGQGVQCRPYHSVDAALNALAAGSTLMLDSRKVNFKLYQAAGRNLKILDKENFTTRQKAIKNAVELANMEKALLKDGLAFTKFLFWLERQLKVAKITEHTAAEKLTAFRKAQAGFRQPSFASIVGFNPNAALPHYTPQKDSAVLEPHGILLIDSGGQYHFGTTDLTRTIPLGECSRQQKEDFTFVLKALIEGSSAVFPAGTAGYQLDAIIRKPLWEQGINYGHGSGHGVGYYLNVHEGPQSFSPAPLPVALQPGMITSIEPGVYREGSHGVRLENLVLTEAGRNTEMGEFLSFRTLTLAPIDTRLVLGELLDPAHINWLKAYNQLVYQRLSPFLSHQENQWLKFTTSLS